MSSLFGFLICTLIALGAAAALFRVGINDGDVCGDARVRVRLLRVPAPERATFYAEIEVDNQNESPIVVSARVRAASVLTLLFIEPHTRRTALTHSNRLARGELLGAVDGRASKRFLLPSKVVGSPRALRVTAVVDQAGRRTRVVTTIARVSGALDGVLPAASDLLPGR